MLAACQSPAPTHAESRSDLWVMSALPLFWPEGGVAEALSEDDGRAQIVKNLSERFTLHPLDVLSAETLRGVSRLMLAQPRALAPAELVALDNWVRAGGALVIFADPQLGWPSRYPMGDPRRAPPVTLLDPLFSHWGLSLAPAPEPTFERADVTLAGVAAEVRTFGEWTTTSTQCPTEEGAVLARCSIGLGEAVLIADADLLDVVVGENAGSGNSAAVSSLLSSLEAHFPAPSRSKPANTTPFEAKSPPKPPG